MLALHTLPSLLVFHNLGPPRAQGLHYPQLAGPSTPLIKKMLHRQAPRPIRWRQFLTEVPSSQMTLVGVELTKSNQHNGTERTMLVPSILCQTLPLWGDVLITLIIARTK